MNPRCKKKRMLVEAPNSPIEINGVIYPLLPAMLIRYPRADCPAFCVRSEIDGRLIRTQYTVYPEVNSQDEIQAQYFRALNSCRVHWSKYMHWIREMPLTTAILDFKTGCSTYGWKINGVRYRIDARVCTSEEATWLRHEAVYKFLCEHGVFHDELVNFQLSRPSRMYRTDERNRLGGKEHFKRLQSLVVSQPVGL